MKKFVATLVILIVLFCTFPVSASDSDVFILIESQHMNSIDSSSDLYIIEDTRAKVQYIVFSSEFGGGITRRDNPNGLPYLGN